MERSSGPTGPQRRQRRAAIACDHCRLKKLRCDAQVPACQHCTEQGQECVRTALEHKARPTRRKIESLEKENRRLQALARNNNADTPASQASETARHAPRPTNIGSSDYLEAAEKTPEDGEARQYHGPTSAIFDLARESNEPQNGHHGEIRRPSSVAEGDACGKRDERHVEAILYAEAAKQRHLEKINLAIRSPDFDGIEPDLASHLLGIFWSRQLHTGLVVYRPAFVRDMACNGPYFSKLLLNAMYYSASKHSSRPGVRREPENKATAGWLYRKRFRELLIEEFDRSSITTIQALLIMAVSLFSRCDERSTSWLYAGTAFNMIIDLGLHASSTGKPNGQALGEEAAEVARRVFWGAYVLDKTQCLLQGRPPILRIADCSTPMLFKDQYEELEPFDSASFATDWSHAGVPLRYMSNMRSLCQLGLIMERILTNLYGENLISKDVGSFYSKASILQTELAEWHAQYSPLAEGWASLNIPPLPHQLTILALYHVLIILLRRPLIVDRDLTCLVGVTEGTDLASESFIACYKAAREIVSILDIYRRHFPISTSPYLLSYATYISATILVRTPPLAGHNRAEGDRLLKICLEALDEHCHLYAAARRTKSAIDVLMRHFRVEISLTAPSAEEHHALVEQGNNTIPPDQENTSERIHEAPGVAGDEESQAMASTWPNFFDTFDGSFLQDADREAVMRSFAMESTGGPSSDGFEYFSGLQGGLDFTLGVQQFDLGSFNDLFA